MASAVIAERTAPPSRPSRTTRQQRLAAGHQAVDVEPGDRGPHDHGGVIGVAQLFDLVGPVPTSARSDAVTGSAKVSASSRTSGAAPGGSRLMASWNETQYSGRPA